jgi:hypothetical protein
VDEPRESALDSALDVRTVISDGENSIIKGGLETLVPYGINVVPLSAGEHVTWVENPTRTVKERVACVRAGIVWNLTAIMIQYLVIHVVNWLNLFPVGDNRRSPYSNSAMKLLHYKELTRARFGEFIIAYRWKKGEGAGQKGEFGVCLGASLISPGSIYFYSYSTQEVKMRYRFKYVKNVDGVKLFGKNIHAAPPTTYASKVSEYNKNLFVALPTGDGSEYSPIKINEEESEDTAPTNHDDDMIVGPHTFANNVMDTDQPRNKENLLTPARKLDFTDSGAVDRPIAMIGEERGNSGASIPNVVPEPVANSVVTEPPIAAVVQKEPRKKVEVRSDRVLRGKKNIDYDEFNRRGSKEKPSKRDSVLDQGVTKKVEIIDVNTMNFKKAVETHGEEANAAIRSELKQIFVDLKVAEPLHLKYNEVPYMRTHDLFDIKMDGRMKARYVVGKYTNQDVEPEWGIDLYAPTIDIKLVKLMLSICVDRDLELVV